MRTLALLLLPLALVACDGADAPSGAPTPAPDPAPAQTEPGPPLIRGTVRDEDDLPVEGVTVHGRLHWGGGIAGWHHGIETETDANGEFTLDIEGELAAQTDAPVTIHLSREGYVSSDNRIPSYRPGVGQWLQIRLRRAGSAAGRVETVEGGPVADALVYVIPIDWAGVDQDDRLPSARTDGDGRYRIGSLPPGKYDIGVKAPGRVPALRGPVDIEREAETAVEPLRTRPGSGVRGRVLTPDGKPVRRATVRAFRNRSFKTYALFGRLAIRESGGTTVTNEDGTFLIDGLDDAAFTVEAEALGHVSVTASVSEVVPPREGIELVLDPETMVNVQILDGKTGKPVPKFVVAVATLDKKAGIGFLETVSSPGGTLRFAARNATPYRVEVTAEGYDVSARRIEPREGESLSLRILLVPRE